MDRKGFLQKLIGGVGVAIIAPQALRVLDRSDGTESTLAKSPKAREGFYGNKDGFVYPDEESAHLTEKFFNYLKDNNVGFEWERVYTPVFELKSGKGMYVNTRKLRTNFNPMWEAGYTEVVSSSPSAGTMTYHQYNTLDEYYDVLFAEICTELRYNPAPERFYIYLLTFTPTMYNPEDFSPHKGLLIRSVTTA